LTEILGVLVIEYGKRVGGWTTPEKPPHNGDQKPSGCSLSFGIRNIYGTTTFESTPKNKYMFTILN